MHTVVYALVPHSDIAKFEVEDGLARGAATNLVSAPTSISQVAVDLATAGTVDLDSTYTAPAFGALMRISAESSSDAHPGDIDDLVGEVASVVGAWAVTSSVIADRADSWVGSATPGVKLIGLLTSAPGIDAKSFDGWVRDAVATCSSELSGVGVRLHTPQEALIGASTFDNIVELSFSTHEQLEGALATHGVRQLLQSELLNADTTQVFTAVEHLLTPNENAWELHDHPLGE